MEKKILVIHMPVLHRGYLELLEKEKDRIFRVLIIDKELQKALSEFKKTMVWNSRVQSFLLHTQGYIETIVEGNLNGFKGVIVKALHSRLVRGEEGEESKRGSHE